MSNQNTPSNGDPTEKPADAGTSTVFTANLHALNLMQQRIFCNRAQQVEDQGEQKRLLKRSQKITGLIREAIG